MHLHDLIAKAQARAPQVQIVCTQAPAQGIKVCGMTADHRLVRPGYIFAALIGTHNDGHDFIAAASARGAVAILTAGPASKVYPTAFASQNPLCTILSAQPRAALAVLAAVFYAPLPERLLAVTGTDGKSSVVDFFRQLLAPAAATLGAAASLGTLGLRTNVDSGDVDSGDVDSGDVPAAEAPLTTPDPVTLCRLLSRLAQQGIQQVALEASSHGLAQHRLDGLKLSAAAWTTLGRDHLDYHKATGAYRRSKERLFYELLPPGAVAIVNANLPKSAELVAHCRARGLRLLLTGALDTNTEENAHKEAGVWFSARRVQQTGQSLLLHLPECSAREVFFPLPGEFQLENLMTAVALALSCGLPPQQIYEMIPQIVAVSGRLEEVAARPGGGRVVIDYAHTPEALMTALSALRPLCRGRLLLVFGCGGDRDQGKRPLMAKAAAQGADVLFVTDDNPRHEDPAAIRRAILAALSALSRQPGARAVQVHECADRGAAIAQALGELKADDIVLIAGKGHEGSQIVGDQRQEMRDHDLVEKARAKQESLPLALAPTPGAAQEPPLWHADEVVAAVGGRHFEALLSSWSCRGVSIDSRTLCAGDLFIAVTGDNHDGHDFIAQAQARGAAAAIVSAHKIKAGAGSFPVLIVEDTRKALEDLAIKARQRTRARVLAITGSAGKTSVKAALAHCLAASKVHASHASYNNHWGVPLTLARLPQDADTAIIEMGMSQAGEIRRLSRLAQPDVALITTVAPAHLEHFTSIFDVAVAKAEIFEGLRPGGTALIVRDSPFFPFLWEEASGFLCKSFGFDPQADAFIDKVHITATDSTAEICLDGLRFPLRLGSSGRHHLYNAAAVLLAVAALEGDVARAAQRLLSLAAPAQRGQKLTLRLNAGEVCVIDDSYNANPLSMRAALESLACIPGRRLAALGDMHELGARSPAFHRALLPHLLAADCAAVFTCGTAMRALHDVLPQDRRRRHEERADALLPHLLSELRGGDHLLVKGSRAARMEDIIAGLKQAHLRHAASKKEQRHAH